MDSRGANPHVAMRLLPTGIEHVGDGRGNIETTDPNLPEISNNAASGPGYSKYQRAGGGDVGGRSLSEDFEHLAWRVSAG
jgi:hypothetical protein